MDPLNFTLSETGRLRCKKFNIRGSYHRLNVSEIPDGASLPDVLLLIEDLFNRILKQLLYDKENDRPIPDTDRVRMAIKSPDLKYEVFIPFVPPSELSTDRVLFEIDKVLQ